MSVDSESSPIISMTVHWIWDTSCYDLQKQLANTLYPVFSCVTKMGKMYSIFSLPQSSFAIYNFLIKYNAEYNFCVFNILLFKRGREKSEHYTIIILLLLIRFKYLIWLLIMKAIILLKLIKLSMYRNTFKRLPQFLQFLKTYNIIFFQAAFLLGNIECRL